MLANCEIYALLQRINLPAANEWLDEFIFLFSFSVMEYCALVLKRHTKKTVKPRRMSKVRKLGGKTHSNKEARAKKFVKY